MSEANKKDPENECIPNKNCCGFQEVANSSGSADNMQHDCISACRWFPLVPMVLGIVAMIAGYALNPSTIRVIWLVISIVMMIFSLFALAMMRTMTRKSGKIICC